MNVKLSKDSWHYRLQKFTHGYDPIYNNLCPYFWNTVYCTLIAPVSFLGKAVKPYLFPVPVIAPDDYYGQKYGATERSNLDAGFSTLLGTFFVLLGSAAVLTLIGAGIFGIMMLFMTPGAAVYAMIALSICAVLFGIGKTNELWWPYLIAAKGKVCPSINWKEDVA